MKWKNQPREIVELISRQHILLTVKSTNLMNKSTKIWNWIANNKEIWFKNNTCRSLKNHKRKFNQWLTEIILPYHNDTKPLSKVNILVYFSPTLIIILTIVIKWILLLCSCYTLIINNESKNWGHEGLTATIRVILVKNRVDYTKKNQLKLKN